MIMSWTVLITGSQSITDPSTVAFCLDQVFAKHMPKLLVHGGAKGVDTLAGQWALWHQIPVKVVPPDFKTWPMAQYKWKAYHERDYAMVDMVDDVVAIWDGKSPGTALTKNYAEAQQKLLQVFVPHEGIMTAEYII